MAKSTPGPKLTPMDDFLSIPALRGPLASLVPLSDGHAEELAAAAGQKGMQSLWYTRIPAAEPASVAEEIALRHRQHAEGSMVPWAVLDTQGRAVGMTTFMHIEPEHRRLEIGSTWLAPSVQGTGVNPQIKLLMLARAFEDLDCIAVEFRTHWHNRQSRAAIAALGAKQDGVLRSHQLMDDGSLRDTVVFSITAAEWPTVRRGLLERLRAQHGIKLADALGEP